jgi:hypothetical protein
MWDLNFGTWISHRGFTVAFGHGHPLVCVNEIVKLNEWMDDYPKSFETIWMRIGRKDISSSYAPQQ